MSAPVTACLSPVDRTARRRQSCCCCRSSCSACRRSSFDRTCGRPAPAWFSPQTPSSGNSPNHARSGVFARQTSEASRGSKSPSFECGTVAPQTRMVSTRDTPFRRCRSPAARPWTSPAGCRRMLPRSFACGGRWTTSIRERRSLSHCREAQRAGAPRSIVLSRSAVWSAGADARQAWLREHLGALSQVAAFIAGAIVLVAFGARGATAALMTLALIATGVANSGPLLGSEHAVPLLAPLLILFNWIATPLAFPVIGIAVLYFPHRARGPRSTEVDLSRRGRCDAADAGGQSHGRALPAENGCGAAGSGVAGRAARDLRLLVRARARHQRPHRRRRHRPLPRQPRSRFATAHSDRGVHRRAGCVRVRDQGRRALVGRAGRPASDVALAGRSVPSGARAAARDRSSVRRRGPPCLQPAYRPPSEHAVCVRAADPHRAHPVTDRRAGLLARPGARSTARRRSSAAVRCST